MMGFGFTPLGAFGWLFSLIWIVWLVVGVLAAVWLFKQIQKK